MKQIIKQIVCGFIAIVMIIGLTTGNANAQPIPQPVEGDTCDYILDSKLLSNPKNPASFLECHPRGSYISKLCPAGTTFYVPQQVCGNGELPPPEIAVEKSTDIPKGELLPGIAVDSSTGFPKGDFRIINQSTGQALSVKLGNMKTITYQREGNETKYYVSDKPTIGTRQMSGGAEEAWYFDTSTDQWGTPRSTIVSVVVGRNTNLGDYCLSRESEKTIMYGCGTTSIARWQSADGYIGIRDQDSYLTVANGALTFQPKDEKKFGQRWRFESPK